MLATFFLLALPVLLLFVLNKRELLGHSRLRPPGPPGLPFIGNLHQMENSAPHLHLYEFAKQYGSLVSLQLGSVETIIVSSEKMAKEVLKTHEKNFARRPVLRGQKKLSYNGLDVAFSPTNDYWREMKKIFVHHLCSVKRVQSFRGSRTDEVSRMIERIRELAQSSKIVNLSEIVMSLSFNILTMSAFGKKFEDQGNGRSKFHWMLNESNTVMGSFFMSDYFPLLGWVDRISGLSSRLDKSFKEVDVFYQDLIDEHLNPSRDVPMSEDIVDTLLRLRREKSTSFDMTLDHVKAILMNVFVAGADTVVVLMIWAMTCLIRNSKSMDKAQREVRMIARNKYMVDEDDVKNLPYLNAVIKETFRLYPPGPLLLPHEAIDKCTINGYEIKPKTQVYINAWAIGRDPEAWDNHEEFMPERFLGSTIDYKGHDFQLIPFGAGRRQCPGIYMAEATMGVTLANLLYLFDWAPPNGMKREDIDTDSLTGLAMNRKNPLCLLATSYKHA